jgi:hypothetical protein
MGLAGICQPSTHANLSQSKNPSYKSWTFSAIGAVSIGLHWHIEANSRASSGLAGEPAAMTEIRC